MIFGWVFLAGLLICFNWLGFYLKSSLVSVCQSKYFYNLIDSFQGSILLHTSNIFDQVGRGRKSRGSVWHIPKHTLLEDSS